MTKIEKGVRLAGRVREIREYGVLVEFDGGDGLLHVSRVAGGSRPSRSRRVERLAPGQAVEVEAVDVKREGKRTKVTLSELWRDEAVIAELQPGSEVSGEVVHKLDCGLFVAIDAGVAAGYDGFVHASELSGADRKVRDQRLASMKVGERLCVSVLRVGRDDRGDLSIKLSEHAAVVGRKLATTFAVGTTHTGRVTRRTEGGFSVSFGDFSGFLPERELNGTSAGSIRVGGGVKTKVLAIEGQRITLTRKGL